MKLPVEEPRSCFSDDFSSLSPPSSPIEVVLAVRARLATPAMVQLRNLSNQPPTSGARALTPPDPTRRSMTPPPYESEPDSTPTLMSLSGGEVVVNEEGALTAAATHAVWTKRGYQPYPNSTSLPEDIAANTEETVKQVADGVGPYRSKKRFRVTRAPKTHRQVEATEQMPGPSKNRSRMIRLLEANEIITVTTPAPSKAPRQSTKVSKPLIPLSCLASVLSRRKVKSKAMAG
ncbi:hypothetical protein RhiLY_07520 [Ceratobasidium sp. AG-Ba]|nr:hypothetical protein RhiLY_07520 [Ceratobasidium sp. AG-Ba]